MQHFDDIEKSELFRGSVDSVLHSSLKGYADNVIPKTTPSSFYKKMQQGRRIQRTHMK